MDNIIFESATNIPFSDIFPIAIDEFVQGEPIMKGIDAKPEDFHDMLEPAMKKWISEGLSIVARDSQSGKVVAVGIATILRRGETTQVWGNLDPKNEVAASYVALEKTLESAVNPFDISDSIKMILEQNLICVHPNYQNKGIATAIAKRTEENGKQKGCDAAMAEASHKATQKLFSKMNYKVYSEYRYDNFYFKGKKVFDLSKMDGHETNTIMLKQF